MRRVLLCLLILCACANHIPAQQQMQITPIDTIWSAPFTLAQTEQADAPALAFSGGQQVAAWIGVDDRGVHQDARRWLAGRWNDPLTLPLPPVHPYEQQLIAGTGGGTHLLWIDANSDGKNNLFSAFLSPDLTVERGPVSVSEGLALSFSAVPDGAGGLWTAWSGGLLAEMSVSARRIDDEGRPLLGAERIAENAADPALLRASDGGVWLFWTAEGQLMRQRIDAAGEAQALTGAISLVPGDRLIDVRAALDTTTAYYFWNVIRKDGSAETWFAAGALDARFWNQPQRLTISLGTAQVDSSLKLGRVAAASLGGDTTLRWLEPAAGQFDSVIAVVESDTGLGIVLLRGGQVVGYTTVVPGVRLIGLPSLVVEDSGDLDLAWAQTGDTNASLQWITTRK